MAEGTGPQGPAKDAIPAPAPRRGVGTGWVVGGVVLLWLATLFVVLPMLTLAGVGEEMMCADTSGDSCPNVSGPLFGIALVLVVAVSTIAVVASRRHRKDIAAVWIVGAFVTLFVGGNIVWNSDHAVAVAAVVVAIAIALQGVITVRMVGGTKEEATRRGLPDS